MDFRRQFLAHPGTGARTTCTRICTLMRPKLAHLLQRATIQDMSTKGRTGSHSWKRLSHVASFYPRARLILTMLIGYIECDEFAVCRSSLERAMGVFCGANIPACMR